MNANAKLLEEYLVKQNQSRVNATSQALQLRQKLTTQRCVHLAVHCIEQYMSQHELQESAVLSAVNLPDFSQLCVLDRVLTYLQVLLNAMFVSGPAPDIDELGPAASRTPNETEEIVSLTSLLNTVHLPAPTTAAEVHELAEEVLPSIVGAFAATDAIGSCLCIGIISF